MNNTFNAHLKKETESGLIELGQGRIFPSDSVRVIEPVKMPEIMFNRTMVITTATDNGVDVMIARDVNTKEIFILDARIKEVENNEKDFC